MSKELRYWGEFRSIRDELYRIEILEETAGIHFFSKRIGFAYDHAAVIEWSDTDKLEPVQGSSLTLTLDSDTDRRFLDLYTIEVGTIRVDVLRDGKLYWSGVLDPELYEEPFSEKQNYDVTITFSDLAVLERKTWEGRGVFSVREVIDRCLAAAGFRYDELVRLTSTALTPTAEPLSFDEVHILGENFYDEEDEALSMREVLEETLRPFALRLVQKNGRVYLYDLNALHDQPTQHVIWSDTDASLGADAVYNNVKVTFSPYANGALIDGWLDYDDVLKDQPKGISGELIHTGEHVDYPEGFRIVSGAVEKLGNLTLSNGAVAYRIDPEYSGSEEAGVLWGYRVGEDERWRYNAPYCPYNSFINRPPANCKEIIRTPRTYFGCISDKGKKYQIRVNLDVLFDTRYNPFEQPAHQNKEPDYDLLKHWCNYGYIPIQLLCYDRHGKLLLRYNNQSVKTSGGVALWEPILGGNIPEGNPAWLTYYDRSDQQSSSGFGGWRSNRQTIRKGADDLPSLFSIRADGEYIELPPKGCYLELRIYSGVDQYDHAYNGQRNDIYPYVRWLMYKNPKVEIVKANGRDIDKEDIEDCAWINKSAKEDLEISTILGTMPNPVPSARGLLFSGEGIAYDTFVRAGHTDRLERLLIGTAYSQYASRKHILSGTVELTPEFGVYTDRSAPGCYMFLGETQHLLRSESEIRMAQFDADNYEAIEYK